MACVSVGHVKSARFEHHLHAVSTLRVCPCVSMCARVHVRPCVSANGQGSAAGFKLASLAILSQTRANSNQTLLEYVIARLMATNNEVGRDARVWCVSVHVH
jgi:hypothetical protein